MEYRKLKLSPAKRRAPSSKSPRITVKGYIGEFNASGKELVAQVCKAWGLPVNRPAALALHSPDDDSVFQLIAVPLLVGGEEFVPVIVNKDATKIKVDLYTYMNAINLHLGKRTKWVIYLEVAPGVDGKDCLFLDTQTDLEEIRRRQSAAQDGAAKSGAQART